MNKQHEIVKLLCESMNRAHQLGVQKAAVGGGGLGPGTVVGGHHTHAEARDAHLTLVGFLLKVSSSKMNMALLDIILREAFVDRKRMLPTSCRYSFRFLWLCVTS